jgi:hypothetical protein
MIHDSCKMQNYKTFKYNLGIIQSLTQSLNTIFGIKGYKWVLRLDTKATISNG